MKRRFISAGLSKKIPGKNGPIIVTLLKSDKPTELKNGIASAEKFYSEKKKTEYKFFVAKEEKDGRN